MVIFFGHRLSLVSVLQITVEACVFFFAPIVVFSTHPPAVSQPFGPSLAAALIFAALMVSVNATFGLYRHDQPESFARIFPRIVLAFLVGLPTAHFVLSLCFKETVYHDFLAEALVASLGVLIAMRCFACKVRSQLLTHRVLVLGSGIEACAVELAITSSPSLGMQLMGFYPVAGAQDCRVQRDRLLSDATPLDKVVSKLRVDEIIVAVREQRGGALPLPQLLSCRLQGVRITDLSGFFEHARGEVPVDCLKASWLIYGQGFRRGWLRNFVKRAFDIALACLLLIVTAPVMVAVPLAIYLESGLPIIIRQQRVGLAGRVFNLIKFRSMRINAEADGMPQWAALNDSRVTKVGRILRRTRIDELPQIFNILKGDMSFVGPRPERAYFVDQFSERIPFYGARHSVKPGLTGWAQVRFAYSASIEDGAKKLQYDLYYVKNHTLILDVMILLATVKVVLMAQGAR